MYNSNNTVNYCIYVSVCNNGISLPKLEKRACWNLIVF